MVKAAQSSSKVVLLVCALLLVGLAACSRQEQATGGQPGASSVQSQPKYGGIAIIAARRDPPEGWDTMRSLIFDLTEPANSVYGDSSLVKPCRDDVFKLCPGLAESWSANGDATQWTFKLREGILWHDGTPFKPEDVKFWLDTLYNGAKKGDKMRSPAVYKGQLASDLKATEVLAGNQVRVTLAQPTPIYPALIAESWPALMQHPQHLMESRINQGEVDISPKDIGWVGTGPFKLVKHDKGSIIQVRRFDKYWEKDEKGGQLPYLDGVDYVVMPDPTAMDAAFRTGRLDGTARVAGHYLTPERKDAYQKTLGDKVWFSETAATYNYIGFNTLRPGPQQDVRVRRALALWMDKRASVQALLGGAGILHPLMNPKSPWPNADWETWPGFNAATREKDKEEAKRLLSEAGYANGFKLRLLCRTVWSSWCEWVQGDLAPLKIQVELDLPDEANVTNARRQANYDIRIHANTTSLPESTAQDFNRRSIAPFSTPVHEDPKVTALFERFGTATQLEARQKVWQELARYFVVDQAYVIPLFGETGIAAYRSYVKGLKAPSEGAYKTLDFAPVWLDK